MSRWSRIKNTLAHAVELNATAPVLSWDASFDAAEPARDETSGPAVQRGVQLRAQALSKRYGEREVLHEVQLQVESGEFVAIVGRSGCGKSTLLRLVAGLEHASSGALLLDGSQQASRDGTRIMFQDARLLPWRRVLANVTLGLPASARERGREVLAQVGLADRAGEWPARLSGGQRQRVALARALVHHPRLLLLDEPLGALDALTRIEMHRLIEDLWQRHGFTALLVTHDVQEAVALADRVVLIEEGCIALDERIALPRPRAHGSAALAAIEQRILDRVLQKPAAEPADHPLTDATAWPGVPAHGLRWAV
ncbi:ATP-binding cassette domain-containing protein [Delftia sp. PS-11]|uniref:ATP-binding cassette domain-containing protein n=1 Tax=Delftia sp. PS-11 TaxID=2767222 RepID=UPI002457D75E|nr:ATP-binding cassette domain-containing protein [Delftia sp. PS-11]KAJ8744244.1 ATP-binding cassette domain-containing protein [Delftia sp. PS-11]